MVICAGFGPIRFGIEEYFPQVEEFLVEKFISEHGAEAFDEVSNWLPGAM